MEQNDATTLPPEDDSDEAGNLTPAVQPAKPAKPSKAPKSAKADTEPEAAAPESMRVRIVLEENDNIPPTGLFVGVNGRSYLIRPGEEVSVPEEVVNALNDAVEDVPRVDSSSNVVDYRKKMRFPYRVLSK